MKFSSILLIGPPGVGKGTQGKVLGSLPGFFHCACGDVFRTLDSGSELGRVFTEYSSRGELVPDEYTVRLWHKRLHDLASVGEWNPADDVLILDGIPRSARQARMLDEYVDVLKVIVLDVERRDDLIERIRRRALRSNRFDDAREDVIRQRLQVYEDEAGELLAHYKDRAPATVDADQPPLIVLERIIGIVKEAVGVGSFDRRNGAGKRER